MKKIILIPILLLVVTGCGAKQEAEASSADNGLMEVDNIQRVLSASDVEQEGVYQFTSNKDVVDGFDTFVQKDKLAISPENVSEYTLYESVEEIKNLDQDGLKEYHFGEEGVELTPQGETYYYLESSDDEIDVVVSVE